MDTLGWEVTIWRPPIEDHAYIIGADASEGIPTGDFSAAYLLDKGEYEFVASFHGKPTTREFAFRLMALGYLYGTALIGCEDMGPGGTVNEYLEAWGYPNLFYRDPNSHPPRRGFKTTEGGDFARIRMINRLKVALETQTLKNPCKELVKEALNFVWVSAKRGGEAGRGNHDDRVMCSAFTLTLSEYWFPFKGPRQRVDDILPRAPRPGSGYGSY